MPEQSYQPYNPLDKSNLGTSVADALLARPVVALPPEPFLGAGVYAIYYAGSFAPYQQIANSNREGKDAVPIYVGKAVRSGARKGGHGLDSSAVNALSARLRQHAASIEDANNIELDDFRCRHLVVDDIWIPLGESLLIDRFSPIWNTLIDGFGNKNPGRGRWNQAKSRWDVLHPGRAWAERLRENESSADEIIGLLQSTLAADK